MAAELSRSTTALTPAHVGLIKLLAAAAVEEYLGTIRADLDQTDDARDRQPDEQLERQL